jgi:hypothetical protein
MRLPLSITGAGAVSPAGWGADALLNTILTNEKTPTSIIARELAGKQVITHVRRVPAEGATTPKFARLRRASPISKFAAAAAIEALGEARLAEISGGTLRVGVIFTLTNGCVNYSNRFFAEALADPSFASPILFPETVFNAPSSHLSAMIGSSSPNDTLVGDSTAFLTGIDLAAEWIERGDVDGCLVVCAEEIDWLSAEGLRYYSNQYIPSEGAAAIYLESVIGPARLLKLPDASSLSFNSRFEAASKIRAQLAPNDDGRTLLVDGRSGCSRVDRAEEAVWADWRGPRWSPRILLGEGMGVSAGLQTVAAVTAVMRGDFQNALVSAVGGNQQAAGLQIGTNQDCG